MGNDNQESIIKLQTSFLQDISDVDITVVIVTYNQSGELIDCLNSLLNQEDVKIEIILINNGGPLSFDLSKYPIKYYLLKKNYGPSVARNLGASIAKTSNIAFLDDDAVAFPDWSKHIVEVFKDSKIIAVRGKIIAKSKHNPFNLLAHHYDFGPNTITANLDLEGNCAVRRNSFLELGGFNVDLYGHEGEELSSRFRKHFRNSRIIYSPKMIIQHDYCDSIWHFINKRFRQGRNANFISTFGVHLDSTQIQKPKRTFTQKITIFALECFGAFVEKVGSTFSVQSV